MSLTALLNQTVTITRRIEGTTKDEFGNVIPDEDTVETTGWLWQETSTEPSANGETSITNSKMAFPAGTDLTTGDAITYRGQEYELVGDPWDVDNPRTGIAHHVEANVRRTAGAGDAS